MTIYVVLTGISTGFFAVLSLLLLLARTGRGARLREALARLVERVSGRRDLAWVRWWQLAAVVAVGLAAVMGFDLATGLYGCSAPGAPSDIGGFLAQGRALWTGGNPFSVLSCGATIAEPDGLAAVLLNALGSLGGLFGIAVVWGAIALTLVPLAWRVGGTDRRYLTLVLVASPIYFPLVATQIDGASNAIVPGTVLLALFLASRSEVRATGLAGFLATARFPTLFPVLGLSGSLRRRFASAGALIAVFAVLTVVSYLAWGSAFFDTVFLAQIGRRSFSLNFWGLLLLNNALPSGYGLAVGQAALTVVLVVVVFFTVRSPVRAAAISLTGVALLTQFLSFDILVWLLPVIFVGARPRWWLWGIAVVGAVNYEFALSVGAWTQGIIWPSELLDVALTVLLVALFVELWRTGDGLVPGHSNDADPRPRDRPRIILPVEVGVEDVDSSTDTSTAGLRTSASRNVPLRAPGPLGPASPSARELNHGG